ncbi:hypothetical protein DR54_178 [Burkholderia pseudomallei HBPUB10303a]|nr:hypothetical protein DR54_178 [Burkholderia pseudomallei HBPUB10303a]CAJ6831426.1 Uncharacterised protein [Burkholderia pseudomallei]CAJ7409124.1 Uncharacterised protein [Burkholderia pseudomallei]CAJ8033145.1 Uncharacterised protein [Burkholderia pseudomallei]CAJ9890467.1 Uncharacterised protein [Burkholderia pseudomallei]
MSMYETVVFERVRGRTESGAPPGSPGRRVGGSAVQRFSGSAVQRFSGSAVQQFSSSAVQQFSSSAVQRFDGLIGLPDHPLSAIGRWLSAVDIDIATASAVTRARPSRHVTPRRDHASPMVTAGIGLDHLARNGGRAFAACPCRPKPTCASDADPVRTNAPARAHGRTGARARRIPRRPGVTATLRTNGVMPCPLSTRAPRAAANPPAPCRPVAASLVFHLSPPLPPAPSPRRNRSRRRFAPTPLRVYCRMTSRLGHGDNTPPARRRTGVRILRRGPPAAVLSFAPRYS